MKKNILFTFLSLFLLFQSCSFLVGNTELFDGFVKEDFDDLDMLVADAINNKVLSDSPEFPPPTKAQVVLASFGLPILNLYFFTKAKVSCIAAWFVARWESLTSGAVCNYFRKSS